MHLQAAALSAQGRRGSIHLEKMLLNAGGELRPE